MAGPGQDATPLVDLGDGELVLLALSLLVNDLAARAAKVSPAVGQKISLVGAECRKRAGIPVKSNTT